MKFIYRYIKPYGLMAIIGLLIKFAASISELFLPSILARMIDEEVPGKNISGIWICGGMMLLFSLIAFIGNISANRMASLVAKRACERVRHDLFDKILHLSCKKTDEITIASLEARLTSDTYNLHNFVARIQRIGVRAPILLVGGICITLFMDAGLTFVLLLTLPFIFGITYFISKKGVKLYRDLQNSIDGMVRVVRENALGIRVIKALSKTDYEIERFGQVNKTITERDKKAGLVMGLSNPIISLFLNIGLCAVVLVGAYRVDASLTQVGKIIAFLNYFIMISNAMLALSRVFIMTSRGIASADRIAFVVDNEDGIDRVFDEVKAECENEKDSDSFLEFRDVTFAYNEGKNVIENISFSLKSGETLGIIGATGSGKSTVLSLLFRFYEPQKGQILLCGRPISSFDKDSFRDMFGVALQNDFIFEGTLRENITFGADIDEKDIDSAVNDSQAKEFVDGLEKGYEHDITAKGTNLSGGQRQRLLIARALARNPKILVLDDSSSALDYRTDMLMRSAVSSRSKDDGIVVLTSQRVSSIKDCDVILVLDDGRCVGLGKHDELMGCCDIYAQIAHVQMGGDAA